MPPSDNQQPAAYNPTSPDKSSLNEKKNSKRETANHKQQTTNNKPIPLFFWSERKFTFKEKENYGDLLSNYLVEKISGRPVKWVHPKKQPWYKRDKRNFLAIGSIIHHASKESIVWGSGIIDHKQKILPADFRAVRGPRTRNFLLEMGHDCPEAYGDPALLLPNYYNPQVEKKYRLGIIPHYHDYNEVLTAYADNPEILIIDMMTLDVEEVTHQIVQCETTISSSLHGLIVSHAYEIPSVWVEFSKKLFGNGVKFADYLESVDLMIYKPRFLANKTNPQEFKQILKEFPSQPDLTVVKRLQRDLLTSSPF